MFSEPAAITLKPIGIVRNEIKQRGKYEVQNVVSEIVIDSSLSEALDNLDEFSHIIVLYWLHQSRKPAPMKVHPRRDTTIPLKGVFATRSPERPNPIGKTTVKLLRRHENVLTVKGLDAIDGTPVLDIKPYISSYDSVPKSKMPPWLTIPLTQKMQYIYDLLMAGYGPQHWWPANEPFEVIVGAILTQSAAWVNVEKALRALKDARALSPKALRQLPLSEIAMLIHSSGYYNAKASKLKAFVDWLGEQYDDDLDRLFANDIPVLRKQLLAIYGIGEETADSIILYAAGKPIFVIDAYTRRILNRIGIVPHNNSYSTYQTLFMEGLSADTQLFNEYHALLVCHAKNVCRTLPLCQQCCLKDICKHYLQRQ